MSVSSEVFIQQLNYGFLLLTHIICADKQIRFEELRCFRKLCERARISQATKNEINKILAQDEEHLTLEQIAHDVSVGEQSEVMRQVVAIAYADGYLVSSERQILDRIASIWNWSNAEIDHIIAEAVNPAIRRESTDNNQTRLSFAARLLQNGKKSALSHAVNDMAAKVYREVVEQTIKQLEREILLSGPEYDEAIKQCSLIAKEDYQYAELAFKKTESTLQALIKSLEDVIEKVDKNNTQAKTAQEVTKQLEETKQSLNAEIIKELATVQESHQAKQRALNYFTIAFMGRTKAGKSTLHSIITKDGWESIGVGKQRTTRFNRIYEWQNIRIIDTPGIGAADAGGREDEEIAKSIVDEADIICYVVTNDSIQETEFSFLKLLKEKAKPLIILLNIKYNLRDARRREHFLKNPHKLFALEGKSGIGGHIDRIRRYAKQHYANDYFDIVPVMLLAAQLSSEAEHQNESKKLYKASRIQDFLDSIRESLIKHGTIRRSQTFLGSTVGAIEHPQRWINKQRKSYQDLSTTLKSKQQNVQRDIERAKQDSTEYLQQQIEATFQALIYAIPNFAEEHWQDDEIQMNLAWKQKIKSMKLEKRLQLSSEEAVEQFNQAIQDSLEEVGKEFQLISQLNLGGFSLQEQDSFSLKNIVKIGGGILAVAGAGLALFFPPLGIAGLIGVGLNLLSNLFESKKEKRRKAVAKISASLRGQIWKQEKSVINQNVENFENYCGDVSENINSYFKELTESLDEISNNLEKPQKSLFATVNYLNHGYAKRIIDWITGKYEPLTIPNIKQVIVQVQRIFGRSIAINTRTNVSPSISLEESRYILHEKLVINNFENNKD